CTGLRPQSASFAAKAGGSRSAARAKARPRFADGGTSGGRPDRQIRAPPATTRGPSLIVSGVSLLAEGSDAFREMEARAPAPSNLFFQGLLGSGVVGKAGVDLLFSRLDRRWTVRRDLNRSFDRSGHDIGAWQHAVNECDAGCELGSYETPGEQQVH